MSRLVDRQRQLAEQGRLRLGYTVPGDKGPRPVRSETWVVTSHARDYVERAAELWGGDVHAWQPMGHGAEAWRVITKAKQIDAILPPGEPLMQAYEMWSAGGCQRRCNGATEQFSGSPCLCIGRFGEKWYEQKAGVVCDTVSRLKVLLPDMPGLGSWRVDTGSFYAADELAGMIDIIRGALDDANVLVPVRLRIEPRTSTNGGQTRQFVVPVLELRGVTAGELLGGRYGGIASVEGAREQKAITAITATDYVAEANKATRIEDLAQIWADATTDKVATDELRQALTAASERLRGPMFGQPEPDPDVLWAEIQRAGGQRGMTLDQIVAEFPEYTGGVTADDASGADMVRYLEHLNGRSE